MCCVLLACWRWLSAACYRGCCVCADFLADLIRGNLIFLSVLSCSFLFAGVHNVSRVWKNPPYHFDDIGNAVFTMFQVTPLTC